MDFTVRVWTARLPRSERLLWAWALDRAWYLSGTRELREVEPHPGLRSQSVPKLLLGLPSAELRASRFLMVPGRPAPSRGCAPGTEYQAAGAQIRSRICRRGAHSGDEELKV